MSDDSVNGSGNKGGFEVEKEPEATPKKPDLLPRLALCLWSLFVSFLLIRILECVCPLRTPPLYQKKNHGMLTSLPALGSFKQLNKKRI